MSPPPKLTFQEVVVALRACKVTKDVYRMPRWARSQIEDRLPGIEIVPKDVGPQAAASAVYPLKDGVLGLSARVTSSNDMEGIIDTIAPLQS